MRGDADVAAAAKLLADATRAAFCLALLDGRFRTAGELARAGGVSASTASGHLARLLTGGLVEVTSQGRHRYFRLAGPEVAAAVEALAVLAPVGPVRSLREATATRTLREGRTCYDHLAGRLGVAVTDSLVTAGVLTKELARADLSPLAPLDLTLSAAGRRPLARPCLDWTERRYHAAGTLPAALTTRLLDLGWLHRLGSRRAVRLSRDGEEGLAALLGSPMSVPAG